MGLFEKLLPDTIPLTEEQFKTFVEQTIATEHSRRILDGLTAQNAATAPAQDAGMAARGNNPACRQDRPYSAGGRRRRKPERGRGARVTAYVEGVHAVPAWTPLSPQKIGGKFLSPMV